MLAQLTAAPHRAAIPPDASEGTENPRGYAFRMRMLELVARYWWGCMRPLAAKHLSPRCRRCVLSSACVPLDDDGLCPECRAPLSPRAAAGGTADAAAALDEMLHAHEGQGTGRHDAVVLFSGGKDSTYMLHRLRSEFPDLRLLAVLVDNGFLSPIALANARRVLRRLDVEHQIVAPPPSFVRRVFRQAFLHLDQQRGYSIVDQLDGLLTFDAGKNLAAAWGIPLVLCGLSRVQAENVLGVTTFDVPEGRERAALAEHADRILHDTLTAAERRYWWDADQWPRERAPRFLFPFLAWPVSEAEIVHAIERLGLLPRRQSSPLLTNNRLIPVIGVAEVARFGYSSWEVEFARNVREGRSPRGYWLALFEMLEYAARTGRFLSKSIDTTLAELGLTRADLGMGTRT